MTVFSIRWRRVAATFVLAFACGTTAFAQERRAYAPPDPTVRAIAAEHGLVVAGRLAAQVGADILRRQRGRRRGRHRLRLPSPIRAPETCGSGYMVIHSAGATKTSPSIIINWTGRDHNDIFGTNGKPDTDKSRNSRWYRRARHIGGLALALRNTDPGDSRRQILKPAIESARRFVV